MPDMGPRTERLSEYVQDTNRPLIIGACPRSGTTLLRTMLDSHPEMGVPRETRFVFEAWERRRQFGDLTVRQNRRKLAHWIFRRRRTRWRVLDVDREEAIKRLIDAPPTLGSLLATCFVMYSEKHGKARWGDKRPTYVTRMRAIWDLFPNAQFINVVRDPRACVASMRKLGWYFGDVAPAAELWERCIKSANSWSRKLAADQLLEVKYEDIVIDPQGTLARVTRFAGLSAEPAALADMLRYYEDEEVSQNERHVNVSRALDETRIGKWAGELDEDEVAFVERVTGAHMEQYGYASVANGVTPPSKLLRVFRSRRRANAAAWMSTVAHDRVRKLVTHRHPLAAEPTVQSGMPASR
jgi:hypothetical protein